MGYVLLVFTENVPFWNCILYNFVLHCSQVWPDDECFGADAATASDELLILRDIFLADLGSDGKYQVIYIQV